MMKLRRQQVVARHCEIEYLKEILYMKPRVSTKTYSSPLYSSVPARTQGGFLVHFPIQTLSRSTESYSVCLCQLRSQTSLSWLAKIPSLVYHPGDVVLTISYADSTFPVAYRAFSVLFHFRSYWQTPSRLGSLTLVLQGPTSEANSCCMSTKKILARESWFELMSYSLR